MHVRLIFNHLCGSIDNSWPRSTAPKGQFTQQKITSDTDEHFSKLAAEFGFHVCAPGEPRPTRAALAVDVCARQLDQSRNAPAL